MQFVDIIANLLRNRLYVWMDRIWLKNVQKHICLKIFLQIHNNLIKISYYIEIISLGYSIVYNRYWVSGFNISLYNYRIYVNEY